ncbi:hypothetical protein TNCV_1686021 [Trichonephila clavipes]|nr:hypothetical protein TNCV_1686021 [Trichonephila clavipes]
MNNNRGDTRRALLGSNADCRCCLGGYRNPFECDYMEISYDSIVSYRVLKMEVNTAKIRYTLQFFIDQGKNASQAAEIVKGVYGADTVLSYGQILNSDLYSQQLGRLKLAIDQKWPELANRRGVVFHQDNARPHMPVVTRQEIWELD